MNVNLESLTKTANIIDDLFPFFIELDAGFSIVKMGRSMKKVASDVIYPDVFEKYFSIKKPRYLNSKSLKFVIEKYKPSDSMTLTHEKSGMRFRGQKYNCKESGSLFLVCTQLISSIESESMELNINDYAPFDTTPDLLFAMQAQHSFIDEIQRINQYLNDQKKELIKLNDDLKNYASIASHDLQSPLRSIVGFSQLLLISLKKGKYDSLKEYADLIVANGVQMKQIIDDLLVYNTVDQVSQEKNNCKLEDVLTVMKNSLWADIKASKASIHHPIMPEVRANRTQMIRLFVNLIGNGMKFRKKGDRPVIHINWKEEGAHYLFEVKDNGIGIEKVYQEKIFKLFQRLHKAEDYEGTGIGLPVCRRIVENHGGRIWIDSKSGEGSTFYFTIEK